MSLLRHVSNAIGAAALVFASAASASAATITFQSNGTSEYGTFYGNTTYSEAGFNVTGAGPAGGPYFDIFTIGYGCTGCPYNGPGNIAAQIQYTFSGGDFGGGFFDYADTLVVSKADNSGFTFNGFDGAEFFGAPSDQDRAAAIRVTGLRADNSSIFQDFTLDGINDGVGGVDDFQSFTSAMTDTFIRLYITGVPNIGGGEYFPGYGPGRDFSLDNLQLGDASPLGGDPVPEPASMLLVGGGLALMARRRRRKAGAQA